MAVQTALLESLKSFTTATASAIQGLPPPDSLMPSEHGITLLDAKNEIFLSYLQALALRNLNVIRSLKGGANAEEAQKLSDDATRKLVEHRVYLERGVRPLEQRIKYQVDKAIKAADDEERSDTQKARAVAKADAKGVSSEEDSEGEGDNEAPTDPEIDELAYRPNPAAFAQNSAPGSEPRRKEKMNEDGVYKPPRISATSMPTTEQRERKERKPDRSRMLDEYVSNELSTAPMAQPSIGSTITAGGRRNKGSKELAAEQERQNYEETNLVRLPKESKKDRAKKGSRQRDGGYGGEEWRGIGDSLDRIGDLTRKKSKDRALDKSRKRATTEDGPRGNGDAGAAFEMKRRRLEKKTRR